MTKASIIHTKKPIIFHGAVNTGKSIQAVRLTLKAIRENLATADNKAMAFIISYDMTVHDMISIIEKELKISGLNGINDYFSSLNYDVKVVSAHSEEFDRQGFLDTVIKNFNGPRIILIDSIKSFKRIEYCTIKEMIEVNEDFVFIATLADEACTLTDRLDKCLVFKTKMETGHFICTMEHGIADYIGDDFSFQST